MSGKQRIGLALALAALINALPLMIFNLGGDAVFHLTMIDCFSRQFWQGNLYPRWCMDANDGLGAPAFLFYFPLPYAITALLTPLTHASMSLYNVLTLGSWLATLITGVTCYLWLKDIASPGRALLASMLLLFMPYRMEVMIYRVGYAELWALAWAPLAFKYTRRLAQSDGNAVLPLAGAFALLLLTHLPCTAVIAIACGLYLLIVPEKPWQAVRRYTAAMLWGVAMSAFYLLPALYCKRFMTAKARLDGVHGWANTYLDLHNITDLGQGRVVVGNLLALLVIAILGTYLLRHRARVEEARVRREILAWAAISACATFLLFRISAPLYALIGPLNDVVFPWRMQAVFIFALTFMIAAWMQWHTTAKRLKTWKADYGMLMALMVLMSYFVAGVRSDDKMSEADSVIPAPYRTERPDPDQFDAAKWPVGKNGLPAAEIISGDGTVTIEHWRWDGIVMDITSQRGLTARLHHAYLPLWAAEGETEKSVTLSPDPKTGLMQIHAPAGKYHVTFTYRLSHVVSWLGIVSNAISILAGAFWLWLAHRKQILPFDNRNPAC